MHKRSRYHKNTHQDKRHVGGAAAADLAAVAVAVAVDLAAAVAVAVAVADPDDVVAILFLKKLFFPLLEKTTFADQLGQNTFELSSQNNFTFVGN